MFFEAAMAVINMAGAEATAVAVAVVVKAVEEVKAPSAVIKLTIISQ